MNIFLWLPSNCLFGFLILRIDLREKTIFLLKNSLLLQYPMKKKFYEPGQVYCIWFKKCLLNTTVNYKHLFLVIQCKSLRIFYSNIFRIIDRMKQNDSNRIRFVRVISASRRNEYPYTQYHSYFNDSMTQCRLSNESHRSSDDPMWINNNYIRMNVVYLEEGEWRDVEFTRDII